MILLSHDRSVIVASEGSYELTTMVSEEDETIIGAKVIFHDLAGHEIEVYKHAEKIECMTDEEYNDEVDNFDYRHECMIEEIYRMLIEEEPIDIKDIFSKFVDK